MFEIDKEFLRGQLDLIKRKQTDDSIEWQDVTDYRSEYLDTLEHRDTVRKGSKLLLEYINAGWVNEPLENNSGKSEDLKNEIEALQRERIKIQTEKLEQNRWRREDVRDEMIVEKIESAIKHLEPLTLPKMCYEHLLDDREFLLAFGDVHFGKELKIEGLYHEIINEYSPEICQDRLWKLYLKVQDIIIKENISTLHIFDLGDELDGLLRVSQLMTLRYGVIDSAIMFSGKLVERTFKSCKD